jgi:hypothetical protein
MPLKKRKEKKTTRLATALRYRDPTTRQYAKEPKLKPKSKPKNPATPKKTKETA